MKQQSAYGKSSLKCWHLVVIHPETTLCILKCKKVDLWLFTSTTSSLKCKYYFSLPIENWFQNWFTDRSESTVALSHCRAASNESYNEEEGSNCNDDHGWDESVHILEEMIVVIVRDEDVGSHVAQDASSGLMGTETSAFYSSVYQWRQIKWKYLEKLNACGSIQIYHLLNVLR